MEPTSGRAGRRCLVVAGGGGFVAAGLLARLAPSWEGEVRVWSRRPVAGLPVDVRVEPIDLREREVVAAAVPAGAAVVNLAYSRVGGREENLALAANLAEACVRRRAERLVHVSTAVVAGLAPEAWVTETTPCRPADEYQRTKLEIEAKLAAATAGRVPLVILRPTAVFGQGGANLRSLLGDLRHGSRLRNYLRSCLFDRRAMHLVPVETVAAAIEFALRLPQPADAVDLYLVGEDEAPESEFRTLERRLLAALGRGDYPIPRLPVPLFLLEALLRLAGRRRLRPATRFSSARLRAAGFIAPLSLGEALDRYARRAVAEP